MAEISASMEFDPTNGSKDIYSKLMVPDPNDEGTEYENNYNYATLHWQTDSEKVTVWVVFKEQPAMNGENPIKDVNDDPVMMKPGDLEWAYMELDAKLQVDEDDVNGNGETTIELSEGISVNVIVKEYVPAEASLEKSVLNGGKFIADGVAQWQIKYTHPRDNQPSKLVDTWPEGMEFVSGSVEITVNGAVADDSDITTDAASRTLTYDTAGLISGDEVIIKFKTKLTQAEMTGIWSGTASKTYTNEVEAQNSLSQLIDGLKDDAAITANSGNWAGFDLFTKVGENFRYESDTYKSDWKVTVKNANQSFYTLDIVDTLGKDLTLDVNTLKINGVAVTGGNYTYESAGKKLTVNLVKDGTEFTSHINGEYVITYTTTIDKDYFENAGSGDWTSDDVKNKAVVEWAWGSGSGIGTGNSGTAPEISKGADIDYNGGAIGKLSDGYDSKTHGLKWKIVLNPHEVNLTQIVFKDELTQPSGYFEHSYKKDGEADEAAKSRIKAEITNQLPSGVTLADGDISLSLDGKTLTIKLGGTIGKQAITLNIATFVCDPAIWGGNVTDGNNKNFQNTVTLVKNGSEGTMVDSGSGVAVPIAKPLTVKAEQKVIGNVLKKANTAYDPENKVLKWKLTVNENGTNLGDITITDILPAGLKYKTESGKVKFASSSERQLTSAEVSGEGTIIINLSNVNEPLEITFETDIETNSGDFLAESQVTFKNKATLTFTSGSEVTVTSNEVTVKIKNQVMDKTAQHNFPSSNEVKYAVNINPNKIDLLEGVLGEDPKLQVKDTFDEGLYLDIDSVKLYKAVVSGGGTAPNYAPTFVKDGEALENVEIEFDALNNSFTADIPDSKESYILEYSAYVLKKGVKLNNDVKLIGSATEGSNNSNSEKDVTYSASGGGGGRLTLPGAKFLTVEITKKNSTGTLLSGAKFGIYSNKTDEASLLAEGTTNADGFLTLALPVGQIKKVVTADDDGWYILYYKEKEAPSGYALDNEWYELKFKLSGEIEPVEKTIINYKEDGGELFEINLIKIDSRADKKPLAEAEFTISRELNGTVLDTQISSADGTLKFENLIPSGTYYIQETRSPEGRYKLPEDNYIKFTVGADGKIADFEVFAKDISEFAVTPDSSTVNGADAKNFPVLTVENKYIPTSDPDLEPGPGPKPSKPRFDIELKKVDSEDESPLSGAKFTLSREKDGGVSDIQTTPSNGVIWFNSLEASGTYYIKEVEAPNKNYKLPGENYIKFTLDEEGKIADYQVYTSDSSAFSVSYSGDNINGLDAKDFPMLTVENKQTPKEEEEEPPVEPTVEPPTTPPTEGETPVTEENPSEPDEEFVIDINGDKVPRGNMKPNEQYFELDGTPIPLGTVPPSSIPKTGVEDMSLLWALGFIISMLLGTGFSVSFVRRRKSEAK